MDCAIINIPTLNRAGHLKRCLDSLANNGWAKYSPLQISVDYPPSPKYEQGYKEVLALLESYDFSRFKSITVYTQKENLGPEQNANFLLKHSQGSIVFTEDDNEFSPNFLEYINKGLQLYENNDAVLSINGMTDTSWFHEPGVNAIPCKLFPAYGVGVWVEKKLRIESSAKQFLLDPHSWSLKNFYTLWKQNPYLLAAYVLQIICADRGIYWVHGELNMSDIPVSIYMHLTDVICIVPIVSKSRTFGNDGSGVHMPNRVDNGLKELDENDSFDFHTSSVLIPDERNYKVGAKYLNSSVPGFIARIKIQAKTLICLFLLYISGKRRDKVIKIVNRFRTAV